MRSDRARPARTALVALVALIGFAAPSPSAADDGPVLHEYVPFDPATESDLGVVTTEGGFKAEVITNSGKITAPDPGRPIDPKGPAYGAKSAVESEKFVADRDVRRPDHLAYDDPFRPKLSPFKRMVAFDTVASDYSLRVSDPTRKKVEVGSESIARTPGDTFYADPVVVFHAGEAIRIPNVVAGTVVKRAHLSPASPFHLERDAAENLFLVVDSSGTARLTLELEAPREAFAGRGSASWTTLEAKAPKLPANVQKDADAIAKELKIDKGVMLPWEATRKLVEYFRDFKESEDPPPNTGDVYLDITRSKKGVCRHRAFAFMITALGLGIPTRFVHNEAHAWVEVDDGFWHRIDLGGAGRILDDVSEKPEHPQPQHEPPADPFPWPPGATKGSDLVPPPSAAPSPSPSNPSNPSSPSPSPTSSVAPSTAPPSKLTLSVPGASGDPLEIFRQKKFSVKGRVVDSAGAGCRDLRVDVQLMRDGKVATVGVLKTDEHGDYDGEVAIPSDLPIGDYSVVTQTPGNATCGAGKSE